MNAPAGNGQFSISQPATPNSGTAIASAGSVSNPAAVVQGDYTINFTMSSGVMMVSVDMGGNQILAPAPYNNGETLNFKGMQVKITGSPADGDSLVVSTGTKESLFTTVKRMIDALNRPYANASAPERAVTLTENNQLLAQLDSALNNVLVYQSDVGSRMNLVENAQTINDNLLLTSQTTLKSLQEIEPADVYSQMSLQLVNLQAAQKSFVNIQNLSAFNYV